MTHLQWVTVTSPPQHPDFLNPSNNSVAPKPRFTYLVCTIVSYQMMMMMTTKVMMVMMISIIIRLVGLPTSLLCWTPPPPWLEFGLTCGELSSGKRYHPRHHNFVIMMTSHFVMMTCGELSLGKDHPGHRNCVIMHDLPPQVDPAPVQRNHLEHRHLWDGGSPCASPHSCHCCQ